MERQAQVWALWKDCPPAPEWGFCSCGEPEHPHGLWGPDLMLVDTSMRGTVCNCCRDWNYRCVHLQGSVCVCGNDGDIEQYRAPGCVCDARCSCGQQCQWLCWWSAVPPLSTGTRCCPRASCRSQDFVLRTVASSIVWPQTSPVSASATGPGSLCQVRVLALPSPSPNQPPDFSPCPNQSPFSWPPETCQPRAYRAPSKPKAVGFWQ